MNRGLRFLSPMDRVLYLRTLDDLEGLSSLELASLAEHAKERRFGKGEKLFEEGELPDAFYIVVEGRVEVGRGGQVFASLGPRQAVGLLSLLSRDERGIDAVATTDTLCLRFETELLMDALDSSFTIVQNILQNASRRYLELFRRFSDGQVIGPWGAEVSCPARPLDLVERIVLLRRAQVFRQTSLDALAELARHMTEIRLDAGSWLWREGDPVGEIHILVCGRVECSMRSVGKSFFATAGFPLGSVETYARMPRWYDAKTVEHVVSLRADSEIMLDLMEDHLDMSLDFLAAVSGRVLALNERLAQSGSLGIA